MRLPWLSCAWRLSYVLCLSCAACGEPADGFTDASANAGVCELLGDDDGDGIRNDLEGCASLTDSDGDGVADFRDTDSDNDGVPDRVEGADAAGNSDAPPPDFDGDGVADFRDTDSDNDGVADGDEDRNGDGLLGLCKSLCDGSGGCGPGQVCEADLTCAPSTTFLCAAGETGRLSPDTDGDGLLDGLEGTRICNAPGESNTQGRLGLRMLSFDQLRLALEPDALFQQAEGTGESILVTFDLPEPDGPTAGFVIAREPRRSTLSEEVGVLLQSLADLLTPATVLVISDGTERTTHDGFPVVANITVGVGGAQNTSPSSLRTSVALALLGQDSSSVSNLPAPNLPGLGDMEADLLLTISVQRRPDNHGAPMVVITGAVGAANLATDDTLLTGIRMDDVATGEIVGAPDEQPTPSCEALLVDPQPTADIIWVIDDSPSMMEERVRVANGAVLFFDRAIASGYDFRMGVVNVAQGSTGLLCTGPGESGDIFLGDQQIPSFQACVMEPEGAGFPAINEYGITAGYRAITAHLPRAFAPDRIRPNAQLVLIYLSDQRAYELTFNCRLEGFTDYEEVDASCMQEVIGPTVDLLSGLGAPGGQGTAYAIVAPAPWSCPEAMESGQGYLEVVQATGGLADTICTTDLDPALERIAADIIRRQDPTVLSNLPIPSTLAVAIDGELLPRSRASGFDYHPATNSLSFIARNFDAESSAELVVSYQSWSITEHLPR